MRVVFFAIIFCSFLTNIFSQTNKIEGYIYDSLTNEKLPFVNIFFKQSKLGTTSNLNGYFSLSYNKNLNDTLVISSIGYSTILIPTINIISNNKQKILLHPDAFNLPEVLVLPGENPAEVILKLILSNKKSNNPESLDYYSCEVYNKIRFDINNFSEDFEKRRSMRHFSFIFENKDTSDINGKVYLPIFFTESLTEFYYKSNPTQKREVIKASKMSGVKNESISQFLGNMHQETSIYDNYITLFEKNFASPINTNGVLFYKYYLTDSAIIKDFWCYKIEFNPRRKQELTFQGHFWVDSKTYAIKSFDMQIVDDANINFINYLSLSADYTPANNVWVKEREEIIIDFTVLEEFQQSTGFFANKITSYDKYSFHKPENLVIFENNNPIITLPNSEKDDIFWENNRHESLNTKEEVVYNMVDSIKSMPVFNTYLDIITTITTGYYIKGLFEIGPYMSLLSFNEIEGTRVGIGFRTSNDFSKTIMPYGNIAYGFRDDKIKYGAGILYMLNKIPRRTLNISYNKDLIQLGKSDSSLGNDNFLATAFTRGDIDNLLMNQDIKLKSEYEWFDGFMTNFSINYNEIYSDYNQDFKLKVKNNTQAFNQINNLEIETEIRYAYKERFVSGEFVRVSLGSKYPIGSIKISKGLSNYDYWKINFNFTHWFNIGALGWSKYIIDAGKIYGNVPYPLLKIHEGNQSFFYDVNAFNMMNYFEFASDKWISLSYTHHFDGLFFNKIPLLRKLKFREVLWTKALYGNISNDNLFFNIFPNEVTQLAKPYIEAGVGIENILKFLRVDAGWRLSHLNNDDISRFSILMSLQVMF